MTPPVASPALQALLRELVAWMEFRDERVSPGAPVNFSDWRSRLAPFLGDAPPADDGDDCLCGAFLHDPDCPASAWKHPAKVAAVPPPPTEEPPMDSRETMRAATTNVWVAGAVDRFDHDGEYVRLIETADHPGELIAQVSTGEFEYDKAVADERSKAIVARIIAGCNPVSGASRPEGPSERGPFKGPDELRQDRVAKLENALRELLHIIDAPLPSADIAVADAVISLRIIADARATLEASR